MKIEVDPCNGGFSPQLPSCHTPPGCQTMAECYPETVHNVPEPSTSFLLAIAFIALLVVKRVTKG